MKGEDLNVSQLIQDNLSQYSFENEKREQFMKIWENSRVFLEEVSFFIN